MIFLVLSGKTIFLFPENMILHVRQKINDDLSQKNKKKAKIWFFLQTCWKDGLFKKDRSVTWFFLYYLERWYFFPENMIIFPLGGKWEIIFLKKYMEIWSFLSTRAAVTNLVLRPSVKKNQRWSYPAKIHLKVIDVLDWHSRKSSSNSQYFHGDLYRRFHYCSAARKKKAKKKQVT